MSDRDPAGPKRPGETRVGVLGGTFDPVHIGHLVVAREMMEAIALDRLLLIPAHQPPHKDPDGVSHADHRVEMLRRAVADQPKMVPRFSGGVSFASHIWKSGSRPPAQKVMPKRAIERITKPWARQ